MILKILFDTRILQEYQIHIRPYYVSDTQSNFEYSNKTVKQ